MARRIIASLTRRNREVLETLTRLKGPSGREDAVQEYFARIMRPYVDKIERDSLGITYAVIEGDRRLPRVMFNAHSDTVGWSVRHIDDLGFVYTDDIGRFSATDFRMLPGCRISAVARRKNNMEIPGRFVPPIPIHLVSEDDLETSWGRHELLAFFGYKSLEQAHKFLTIGDFITFDSSPRLFQANGNPLIESAFLDDRIGLFTMYMIAKNLKARPAKRIAPVAFVSTVQEETISQTAQVASEHYRPQIAINIDVHPSADQVRMDNEDLLASLYGTTALGKGVVVPRGVGIHDDLFLHLENICRGVNHRGKISFQPDLGDHNYENVFIQLGKEGVQAALLGVPIRWAHTDFEVVALQDVEATIKLGEAIYRHVCTKKYVA